ncbi:TPA: YadA C-terminal domain-containing protein [Proteus mirabilis]
MNYNKLFLISISLIYSANTFSNTDGLPPRVGNQIESNQETNGSDNKLDPKKRKYTENIERVVYSLPQYEHEQRSIEFENYIDPIQTAKDSSYIEYIVAAPVFDEMIALFTKNSDSTVPPPQNSVGLNLSGVPIEQKREMLRYLWGERVKIIDLSKRTKSIYYRRSLESLSSNINYLMQHIEHNIDTGNETQEVIIKRNDKINEPLYESFLKEHPARLLELMEMEMLFDDRFSDLDSRSTQTATELADTRTELSELDETVKQHEEDIEEQGKDITQVKQTADENKKHVDKYLVNNFQVSGESRNLINHLGALYLENKSNSLAISSLRNDFEHFKDETNNRFYKVEKRANQGIASVAAMSNLPFNDAATFSTAMGIGNYRNATAFAWGMQYRINENVKVKASTAWNDANNWVSAGGIGISW